VTPSRAVAPRLARSPGAGHERLARAVDLPVLVGLGWDPDTKVFTPDPAHRLLGYRVCAVAGCGSEAWCRNGLCGGCATRRAANPGQPLEAFLAAGMGDRRRAGERLCAVCRIPGATRPAAANGLCLSCDRVRAARGQSVAGFVDGDGVFDPAEPRRTIGICAVASCGRLVARRVHGLCEAHDQAWRRAGRPEMTAFCRTSSPRRGDRRGRVVLRGLPDAVILELLLGVQVALAEVLTQLLDPGNLDALETLAGPGWRAAVELLAGVGRRPSELCGLRLECLDYDERTGADGAVHRSPVLVHDMPKVGKVGCRLPIHDREARIITAQQSRVRTAYPQPERLALFPRALKNPDGAKPVTASGLALAIRGWVDGLPRLDADERGADGRLVPFPRERVFPYAFRHTYAQRHADAGTPVDTLKELLGHDTVRTTLGYYRVTAKRKRDAADRLGPLQIDARGQRVRPALTALADTEALREQVGQVAVPFGICTEPTNVAAGGHSCPFRHRCTGCEYFRTDPSYTPELQAYLAQLLVDKERLAAAVPALAEWARRDAAPSDAEIDALRRLLRANDEVLAGLDEDDRAVVEAAIATIRKERAQLAATFPVELAGLARQHPPVFFPNIERAARAQADHG